MTAVLGRVESASTRGLYTSRIGGVVGFHAFADLIERVHANAELACGRESVRVASRWNACRARSLHAGSERWSGQIDDAAIDERDANGGRRCLCAALIAK